MNDIIEDIKKHISKGKTADKVVIRGVKAVHVLTYEYLREKVESGELGKPNNNEGSKEETK